MGFKYTDAAFKTTKVRGIDKYVLLLICERANNDNGVCWPSMRTIAKDGGISPATVCDSVNGVLVPAGLVQIVVEGHERKSNRYKVVLEVLCPPAEHKSEGERSPAEYNCVRLPNAAFATQTQRSP